MDDFELSMPQADTTPDGDFNLDIPGPPADDSAFFAPAPQNVPFPPQDFAGPALQTYLPLPVLDTNNNSTSSVADMTASFYSHTSSRGFMAPQAFGGHFGSQELYGLQERQPAPSLPPMPMPDSLSRAQSNTTTATEVVFDSDLEPGYCCKCFRGCIIM